MDRKTLKAKETKLKEQAKRIRLKQKEIKQLAKKVNEIEKSEKKLHKEAVLKEEKKMLKEAKRIKQEILKEKIKHRKEVAAILTNIDNERQRIANKKVDKIIDKELDEIFDDIEEIKQDIERINETNLRNYNVIADSDKKMYEAVQALPIRDFENDKRSNEEARNFDYNAPIKDYRGYNNSQLNEITINDPRYKKIKSLQHEKYKRVNITELTKGIFIQRFFLDKLEGDKLTEEEMELIEFYSSAQALFLGEALKAFFAEHEAMGRANIQFLCGYENGMTIEKMFYTEPSPITYDKYLDFLNSGKFNAMGGRAEHQLGFKYESSGSEGADYIVILGFRIVFVPKMAKRLSKNYYENMLAFAPTGDREFHRLTCGSTTNSKICIWETWMDVRGIKSLRYSRDTPENRKDTNKRLNEEGKEITELVKKGQIIDALKKLTKKHGAVAILAFFKQTNPDIIFTNGVMTEGINLYDYKDKKAFLYHQTQQHVAPCYIAKLLEKEKVTKKVKVTDKYTLRPIFLKTAPKLMDNVFGYDAETFPGDDYKATTYDICVYGMCNGKKYEEQYYGLKALDKFVSFIRKICTPIDCEKSRPKTEVKPIYIYGYNNENFDNLLVYEKLYDSEPNTKFIFTNNSVKQITYHNVRIFDLRCYYQGGLKKVASDFKLKESKGAYPFKFPNINNLDYIGEIPDKKFFNDETDYNECLKTLDGEMFDMKKYTNKYCLLDAQLTYQIAVKHLETCITGIARGENEVRIINVQECGTAAGASLKSYQQGFQKETLTESPENIQEHERESMFGGRVGVFKKHFDINDEEHVPGTRLNVYDINSSYPASMTEYMPYRYLRSIKNETEIEYGVNGIVKHWGYYCRVVYVGDDPAYIPNILTRDNKSACSAAVKESPYGWRWGRGLIEAIKNGCKVFVTEYDVYESKILFKEFVEWFYKMKNDNKESNPVKSNFNKIILNSLYGKFAQRAFTTKFLCDNAQDMYDRIGDGELVGFTTVGDKFMVEYQDPNTKKTSIGNLVRLSSYIADCSRTRLAEAMRNVGHKNVYYGDTDSLHTTQELSPEFLDNNILGKWKVEYEGYVIQKADYLAKKTYCLVFDKPLKGSTSCIKSKGMNPKLLNKEDFEFMKNNPDGKLMKDMTMFFKTFNGVYIKPTSRGIQPVYNERIFYGNSSSAYNTIEDWKNHCNTTSECDMFDF